MFLHIYLSGCITGKPVKKDLGVTRRRAQTAWLETAEENESVETTIRWPRLLHRHADMTGAHTASAPQFCVEETDQYTGHYYNRPFAEPYRPDLKYTTQRVTRPALPPSMREALEQQIP